METARSTLPEFHRFRFQSESSPEIWKGNFASFRPTLQKFGFALGEGLAAIDGGALVFGDPCADLRSVRSGAEVGFGFLAGGPSDCTSHQDLAFEFLPEKDERAIWILGQITGFARAVVGEEAKAPFIESFE